MYVCGVIMEGLLSVNSCELWNSMRSVIIRGRGYRPWK